MVSEMNLKEWTGDKDVGRWGTLRHMQSIEAHGGLKVYSLLMALSIVLSEKRLRDSVEHDKQGNCRNIRQLVGE